MQLDNEQLELLQLVSLKSIIYKSEKTLNKLKHLGIYTVSQLITRTTEQDIRQLSHQFDDEKEFNRIVEIVNLIYNQ